MMPRTGIIKTVIWRTGVRQTILIIVTFASKPRGRYPKSTKIQKGDNKEIEEKIEENEKANIRRPNNEKPSNGGQDLKAK